MGRDKALVEVDGLPLVSRVVDAVRAAGAAPVAVVGHRAPHLLPSGLEVAIVADRHPGQGPVGGVVTALAWSPAPVVLVLACDLPHLEPADLVRLCDAVDGAHPVAVIVGPHGREPLLGAWHRDSSAAVNAAFACGIRSMHDLLACLPRQSVPVADVPVADARSLHNVNRPADLPSRSSASGQGSGEGWRPTGGRTG
jgi:molybdenum cofactor guanylyltransferase